MFKSRVSDLTSGIIAALAGQAASSNMRMISPVLDSYLHLDTALPFVYIAINGHRLALNVEVYVGSLCTTK